MSSLFDELDDEWREVPQALFLSWSPQMQYAYCAARDEDSAGHANSLEELEWFQQRARAYREMSHVQ